MPFIESFSINCQREHPFPYNIAGVRHAKNVDLDPRVTIFVGDNGCGKSTLLECIGLAVNVPLIGGFAKGRAGFDAAVILKPFVEIKWKRHTHKGFFFRAEDFSDFIKGVEWEERKMRDQLRELEGNVDESIIHQMASGMNYNARKMREDYGDDMQAYSHGEAYLKILQTRVGDKGIFLLDEPEASLSPLRQLSLMALMMEVLKGRNAQFIIATHSPLLMGFPEARIYQIDEDGMQQVPFEETNHYRITKRFLDNPEYYLRHM